MRRDPDHADLERFLADHGDRLLRIAIALAGSRAEGEDLLQAALERLLPRWRDIQADAAESYLRRTLYNLAADGWRRRGAWRRVVPLLRTEKAAAATKWRGTPRSAGPRPSRYPDRGYSTWGQPPPATSP